MEQYSTYIGLFAGICTCVSLLPQLIKIIREKEAQNLSYGMLFILLTGVGTWVWYGIIKDDLPIILTNSISFFINVLVIIFTMKYRQDQPVPAKVSR
jgi:MtN3 and saliva related transmembrane protein